MTNKPRFVDLLALSVALLVGACGDVDSDEVPEVLLERASAFRQACAAQEIASTAQENLEMLESTTALMQPDTVPGPGAPLGVAAVEFSRAYLRHAELRSTVYALLDSAANHATGTEDSTLYVQRANAFTIRPPEPGTVEANVIESFEENIIRILSDDDHRCNWDIPSLQAE